MRSLVTVLWLLMVVATEESALEEFARANNIFATSLYRERLTKNEPNFLISPYSAETVLAFAMSGSKGGTAEEIRTTLNLPEDKSRIESAVKESISSLKGNGDYTLRTANKMYVKNGFSIKEEFKKAAQEIYSADVENINFVPTGPAASRMNQWVEEQTDNKIKNLISPDILDEYARTILINAIYFKGNWKYRFDESSTSLGDFYKTKNDVVQVNTMHSYYRWLGYYENPELKAKVLELPFEGGDVSMVIVLPDDKEGLTALENQIDKVLGPQGFRREVVNVALPKFKIETTMKLVETLKNLGIKKAFNDSEADFSGIAGIKGDLVVNDVLQKTYIDVEEEGGEAAAATYVYMVVPLSSKFTTSLAPEPEPKQFIADHPFIFYIKAKNIIVFAGKVSDPKQ